VVPNTRVVVYGSSLYMAGIAATLQANPTLEVVRIPTNSTDFPQCLDELAPEVIVVDLGEAASGLAVALLSERPGLLLLGVDPDSDEIMVLSGQRTRVLSGSELALLASGRRAAVAGDGAS
jgi:DNA-binding NarL/FixJ family response regulator